MAGSAHPIQIFARLELMKLICASSSAISIAGFLFLLLSDVAFFQSTSALTKKFKLDQNIRFFAQLKRRNTHHFLMRLRGRKHEKALAQTPKNDAQ
jgi:hypothetical protein